MPMANEQDGCHCGNTNSSNWRCKDVLDQFQRDQRKRVTCCWQMAGLSQHPFQHYIHHQQKADTAHKFDLWT